MADTLSVPPVLTGDYAFFLDLDGTLAEIKPQPSQVFIPENVRHTLARLARLQQGAVALISGRSMAELDALVSPYRFPVAGVHGAERRDIHGQIHRVTLPVGLAAALEQELRQALRAMPGCKLEAKGMAFALHFRQAPQYAQNIQRLAETLVSRHPELAIQPGKCVVDIKPAGINKGAAISAFMQEPPFFGRLPVFVGDDLTDEAGFMVVNQCQGISVKVGAGDTAAHWRFSRVAEVHQWLWQLAQQKHHAQTGRRTGYESIGRRI